MIAAALALARSIASEWQQYRADATLDKDQRDDYGRFPSAITLAVYYRVDNLRCIPTNPTASDQ